MKRQFFYYLNRILQFLESRIFVHTIKNRPFKKNPIFIVGAPRSGTTILKLLILTSFKAFYITNIHEKFYGSPVISTFFMKLLNVNPKVSEFNSDLGYIKGSLSPSEASKMWHNWFPWSPEHVRHGDYNINYLRSSMRKSLLLLDRLTKRPQVYKHVRNSLRIDPIIETIPEAKFIIIKRNIHSTVESIYKARLKTNNDEKKWWSIMPPDLPDLKNLSSEEEIVYQVHGIYKCIDESIRKMSDKRYLTIYYEEMIDDPQSTMKKIADFYGEGLDVQNSQVRIPIARRNESTSDPESTKFQQAIVKIYGKRVDYA